MTLDWTSGLLHQRIQGPVNLESRDIVGKQRSRSRYEDFQSSCRTETICRYRSLLVSIQAFNGGLGRSILPIRTHSVIYFFQSTFKAASYFEARLLFPRQWKVYVLPRFRHKTRTAED